MLFISKGRKFFCSRENNFMSGASRADWNRWKVHCLELKGRKKRSLGWREDFEKVGEGRPGKLISYCVYSPQNPVCLLLFWTNLPIEIEPLRWSAASMNEGFPGGSDRKEYTCKAGDPGSVPGLERSLGERRMAPHPSILAWRIPWTEKPGWLQSPYHPIFTKV